MLKKKPAVKSITWPAIFILSVFIFMNFNVHAQRYLSDYDSSLFTNDTLKQFLRNLENISFSGYMQPQFQVAQQKGIRSYSGGDFREFSDNRFMLRRARFKIDYRLPSKNGSFPAALFTFQFEATERDVNVRDMFVKIYEPRRHNISLTTGLFARPFGFEVNFSSSFRESPERGRMSQSLMPSERDLGAMLSFESQKKDHKSIQLKFDAGLFNGQGKSGPAEFDGFKDLISRLALKPFMVAEDFSFGAGLSFLRGGWVQATRYKWETISNGNGKVFAVDSAIENIGRKAPRHYYGGDVQLIYKHAWGKTEIRSEYWKGRQPGTLATTVNPGVLPELPTYIRNFDGAFFYFLQNIGNEKWELIAKYDWYDPNVEVAGMELNTASNFSEADIKFSTLGLGMAHSFNENLKLLVYHDWVRNENTALNGFMDDVKDNVFTWRIQFRF